ncbi:MAG: hypothetical protein A3F95_02545 [Candidatus Nealsonbacteria bacterium RIFCSPLOWO2_12_FULL_39_31]|uniref:Type IV pilus modification protein PilV n=3 Tax=Candidatus Nealsoniibacteriota TaxID=1817911 RepID=A0A1G2EIW5_9BACT|nr:MAG: hypothetical protein UT22_C0028G0006 [Parcubacteria group bacterium GW2011_GWC2_39_11]OGZ19257.1 MAG: hypothetical protein A2626_03400 [Candidatus Nealsonbacteria bacterium RIFCSPHIGHO2_01_FULL_38_55]OGZ21854.1 MAG: hypothetical protein A3C48_01855 [Candidatus Nealsonbacteria bacterium RIFCSPHIGHO2_02_FULL_38_75]OGZ22877.1 MAG: hypothetical protein A3E18_01510 [Candidatus Nealsonbacteria bacterium RIFCSPHIGHO2_12_FULL_38_18]OGZ23809.1 MAG: hypothetical protein A2981_00740 [Candidatus Ne
MHTYDNMEERRSYNNGFTIIETIIAVLIVLTGVAGAYGIITNLTSFGTISPSRLTAVYLAKEGVEIVRNIRDTNWLEGHSWDEGLVAGSAACAPSNENSCTVAWDSAALQSTGGTVPFLKIDNNSRYNYAIGTATIFKRKIKIAAPAVDYLLVEVIMEWSDRGKPYSLTTRERIYNWYQI